MLPDFVHAVSLFKVKFPVISPATLASEFPDSTFPFTSKITSSAFISFIVYGVFNQNRIDPKVKRVPCQNSVTTFEKIYSTDLKFAKELLLSSNYIIESKIEYSKSMKSNLYNIFSNKQSDQILNDVLSKFKNSDKKYDKKLLISYYIYENDKEDKGKKK